MNEKEFSEILLKNAFAATVCDGDIAEAEIDLIKNFIEKDFYLKNFDLDEEFKKIYEILKIDCSEYSSAFANELYSLELTSTQKMILINQAIAIVRADNVMQEKEIKHIKSLMLNLMLLEEIVESVNGKWWIIEE